MNKWKTGTLLLNLVFFSLGGLITLGIISAQFDRLKPLIEQIGYSNCERDILAWDVSWPVVAVIPDNYYEQKFIEWPEECNEITPGVFACKSKRKK